MTRSNLDEVLRASAKLRGASKATDAVWRDGAHRVGRVVVAEARRMGWRFTSRSDGAKIELAAKYRVIKSDKGFATWTVGTPPGPWVLFQRGSYKKPNGWDVVPFRYSKRTLKSFKKRGLQTTFGANERGGRVALRTPYGPRLRVHHPHLPPPFQWSNVKARSRPQVTRIAQQTAGRAIARTMQGR